jgi:hypothetical protein
LAQSALVAHATQRFEGLQIGVVGEEAQSAFVRQTTHSFFEVSQMGAARVGQSLFSSQMTHDPAFAPVSAHAGPPGAPVQSLSSVQAWHVWVVVSHVGAMPAQSELYSQLTHIPLGKSQTRLSHPVLPSVVVPSLAASLPASDTPASATPPEMQMVSFVDEHWPHAPETWHAGVAPPQSESWAHGWQRPLLSQIGVYGPHWLAVTHSTHV